MRGERMREQLDALVRNWDHAAVPRHGRYVREPAVIDEQGVRHVPPPVTDPQLVIVAGIGLLTVAGVLLMRNRSRWAGSPERPLRETHRSY
jgi:alkanesulfonate monooxygenase SsuD/methylene tetrahydromethanopterin reductase-like flavin-dependent oxidoreductase (luciferase family)